MSKDKPDTTSNAEQVMQFLGPGLIVTQAIYVAVRLGIPDVLADGPKSALEIAEATGAHAPTLSRLLGAISTLGLFTEDQTGQFSNTALGEMLREDNPESVRAGVTLLPASFCWRPLGEMYESVRTGQPAFDRIYGQHFFDYLAAHPGDAAVFDAAMTAHFNPAFVARIVDAYDFSQFSTIVDVGGGQGAMLKGILLANPRLHGILFDLPNVVAGAVLPGEELAGRAEVVPGSFFGRIPEGADAYLFRSVLGDWDDEHVLKILKSCRQAIPTHGTLLLMEGVVPKGTVPKVGWGDLLMLVLVGGRERTLSDFESLLQQTGFSAPRIVTKEGISILESHPI